jgi:hypothetical protein
MKISSLNPIYNSNFPTGYGMTEMTVATHLPVLDKPRHESTGKLAANLEMKVRYHIQLIKETVYF